MQQHAISRRSRARTLALLSSLAFMGGAALAASPVVSAAATSVAAAFRTDLLAKARAADKTYSITVPGRDGWLFFAPELRHIGVGQFWGRTAAKVSQSTFPEDADPIPAIVDFKEQLQQKGIELLLVPVPPKAIIYADKASGKAPADNSTRLDVQHQKFYDLLREKGVKVLDLTPEFLQQRDASKDPLYCKQDTHWAGRGTVLAARRIRETVREQPWLKTASKRKLDSQWKRITIQGDLWQALPQGKKPPEESLPLRFVGKKTSTGIQPVLPERKSPVLLLGDSHCLVFHEGDDMHARGAGLPDQLALEFGFPVDLEAVRGSGATPARVNLMRRARADSKYLAGKKLVVWCFSAREFTESLGWQKVPLLEK